MRVSTYELFLPLTGEKEEEIKERTLLLNGLYGALDILKKEDADRVKTGDSAGKASFAGTHHLQG